MVRRAKASTCEECLGYELTAAGIAHRRQVVVPVRYKNNTLECGFRLDVLVEQKVIVEVKAVEELMPIHESQLLTYLRLAEKPPGLLINFDVRHLREGVRRLVLTRCAGDGTVLSPSGPLQRPP